MGLAAGVTEFELPDPVVALQGSATAAAPHLVVAPALDLHPVDAFVTSDDRQAAAARLAGMRTMAPGT